MSPVVQASPSSQAAPSGSCVVEQVPLLGSQIAWEHGAAGQATEPEPTQAPPWQTSVGVHPLPS